MMKKVINLGLTAALITAMIFPISAQANSYGSDGNTSIPITATIVEQISGNYAISVPAVLTLEWVETNKDYENTYTLAMKGDFKPTDVIDVGPAANKFTMTGAKSGKTTQANITQRQTSFLGSAVNKDAFTDLTTGRVTATFPSYEEYEGGVSFTFKRTER